MIANQETAAQVAASLLKIKAIKLNGINPFTWASGLRSPIYCDNRISLSYPEVRSYIKQEMAKVVKEHFGSVDVVAGVATAGIPQGALVAEELGLPFIYVRSEKKSHGMTNMIEGVIKEGQSVVVIEDLVSTGKSSLNAVFALREAGVAVAGMVSIFSYGLKVADENFVNAGCKLVSLSDYDNLIKQAVETNYVNQAQMKSLLEWRNNPQAWSDAHQNS
jgi:orotate phosphoribosyltransferase